MTKPIVLIGPMPPPVHGMSKNFLLMFEELSSRTKVVAINISPGSLNRDALYYLRRLISLARAALVAMWHIPFSRRVYIPPDGGLGLLGTLWFALIAAIFDKQIFLHHRTFSYVDKGNRLMELICTLSGDRVRHVFLCDGMRCRFEERYGSAGKSTTVSNLMHVAEMRPESKPVIDRIRKLGFLSNIELEKGIDSALDVLWALHKRGETDITLVVGGPFVDENVESYVLSHPAVINGLVEFSGFVKDKAKFFREIDLLLFPTRYRNEAQPNVVFESLAFGIPVIATNRGCLKADLQSSGSIVLESDIYISGAVDAIIDFRRDIASYAAAVVSARTYVSQNIPLAKAAYSSLVEDLLA